MSKASETAENQELTSRPEQTKAVVLEIKTPTGETWGQLTAPFREFKTGSTGYYASGKVTNPHTGEKYQVGCNIILVGSKKK